VLYIIIIFLSGKIPSDWRLANVTPVFKKGISLEVPNYRPISLTSSFSKTFERIVKQQILLYLLYNHLISRQQFGFLPKCSTCTQLLDCVNDWTLSIRNRHSVDVIMVALWNRADHYIFILWFLSIYLLFSSPNLSGRTLDVYHTSTHDVALVQI